MENFFVSVVLLALAGLISSQTTAPYFFTQCLDHIGDPNCTQTFTQRYWTKFSYYDETRPGTVFFQFGGDSDVYGDVDTFYWQNYAKNHNALVLLLEHRFYGQSYPNNTDPNPDLSLLSTHQAIEDAAKFIAHYKKNYPTVGVLPWIAFGRSYAGALAAYFIQKYPTVFAASVLSSAPLEATYSFPAYTQTVSQVIQDTQPESCFSSIREAFTCMESVVIEETPCGNYSAPQQLLSALEYNCPVNFTDAVARESFFYNIAAQGGWFSSSPATEAEKSCSLLASVSTTADAVKNYGAFLTAMRDNFPLNCSGLSLEDELHKVRHEHLRKLGKGAAISAKDDVSWDWQICNEFGFFMASDPVLKLFGANTFSSEFFAARCLKFGQDYTFEKLRENVEATNELYGGKGVNVTCTIFVNGEYDPWQSQGITKTIQTGPLNTVIFVPKGQHCDDTLDPATSDEMAAAQEEINAQIGRYAADSNCFTN